MKKYLQVEGQVTQAAKVGQVRAGGPTRTTLFSQTVRVKKGPRLRAAKFLALCCSCPRETTHQQGKGTSGPQKSSGEEGDETWGRDKFQVTEARETFMEQELRVS